MTDPGKQAAAGTGGITPYLFLSFLSSLFLLIICLQVITEELPLLLVPQPPRDHTLPPWTPARTCPLPLQVCSSIFPSHSPIYNINIRCLSPPILSLSPRVPLRSSLLSLHPPHPSFIHSLLGSPADFYSSSRGSTGEPGQQEQQHGHAGHAEHEHHEHQEHQEHEHQEQDNE